MSDRWRGASERRSNRREPSVWVPARPALGLATLIVLLGLVVACSQPTAPPSPGKAAEAPAAKTAEAPTAKAPAGAPATSPGAAAPAKLAAGQSEVVPMSDALVKAAKAEGTLTVRYSSPADTMESVARSFEEQFGIKVQTHRKVGALGTQQFATEERAGQHVIHVNWTVDPPGLRKLGEEGLYLNYTLADFKSKLPEGTCMEGWGYGPYWTEIVISYNPKLTPHAEAMVEVSPECALMVEQVAGPNLPAVQDQVLAQVHSDDCVVI